MKGGWCRCARDAVSEQQSAKAKLKRKQATCQGHTHHKTAKIKKRGKQKTHPPKRKVTPETKSTKQEKKKKRKKRKKKKRGTKGEGEREHPQIGNQALLFLPFPLPLKAPGAAGCSALRMKQPSHLPAIRANCTHRITQHNHTARFKPHTNPPPPGPPLRPPRAISTRTRRPQISRPSSSRTAS